MATLGQRRWQCLTDETALWRDHVSIEMLRARRKFAPFHSWHEAAAVIREEFEEFWASVKANDPDPQELVQVAAMAMTAILELCPNTKPYLVGPTGRGRQSQEEPDHA